MRRGRCARPRSAAHPAREGVAIAFTSIRHALGQLELRGLAEQVGDSNTWRNREGGGENVGGAGEVTTASAE